MFVFANQTLMGDLRVTVTGNSVSADRNATIDYVVYFLSGEVKRIIPQIRTCERTAARSRLQMEECDIVLLPEGASIGNPVKTVRRKELGD